MRIFGGADSALQRPCSRMLNMGNLRKYKFFCKNADNIFQIENSGNS